MSRVPTAAVLLTAGLAASACGSTASSSSPASTSTGRTVVAVEKDYSITLNRSTFAAGRYTFHAENQGAAVHALSISGPGLAQARTSDIPHGADADLTVTLRRGTYDVFCPVANHKMLGMDLHITVT